MKVIKWLMVILCLVFAVFMFIENYNSDLKTSISDKVWSEVLDKTNSSEEYLKLIKQKEAVETELAKALPQQKPDAVSNKDKVSEIFESLGEDEELVRKYSRLMDANMRYNFYVNLCMDGTVASSYGEKGSCSWHGGNSGKIRDTGICMLNCSPAHKVRYEKYSDIFYKLVILGGINSKIDDLLAKAFRSAEEDIREEYNRNALLLKF